MTAMGGLTRLQRADGFQESGLASQIGEDCNDKDTAEFDRDSDGRSTMLASGDDSAASSPDGAGKCSG